VSICEASYACVLSEYPVPGTRHTLLGLRHSYPNTAGTVWHGNTNPEGTIS